MENGDEHIHNDKRKCHQGSGPSETTWQVDVWIWCLWCLFSSGHQAHLAATAAASAERERERERDREQQEKDRERELREREREREREMRERERERANEYIRGELFFLLFWRCLYRVIQDFVLWALYFEMFHGCMCIRWTRAVEPTRESRLSALPFSLIEDTGSSGSAEAKHFPGQECHHSANVCLNLLFSLFLRVCVCICSYVLGSFSCMCVLLFCNKLWGLVWKAPSALRLSFRI